uniref:Uncharacterized protein n=1 Tax=Siphoviridae sp. ctksc2 TaxID=2825645 RepID=A0A8S5URR0_9CAUD|nr:MAG TPA: hypothetical protein [Siphoviridae sp. ctksc2]
MRDRGDIPSRPPLSPPRGYSGISPHHFFPRGCL